MVCMRRRQSFPVVFFSSYHQSIYNLFIFISFTIHSFILLLHIKKEEKIISFCIVQQEHINNNKPDLGQFPIQVFDIHRMR